MVRWKNEANGVSCEAAREHSQPTSTKLYITPLFLCISNHYFLLSCALCWKEYLQRGLRHCSLENVSAMMALFYLCLRKVGTEFSHEIAASDYDRLQWEVVQIWASRSRSSDGTSKQDKDITYDTSKKGSRRIGS